MKLLKNSIVFLVVLSIFVACLCSSACALFEKEDYFAKGLNPERDYLIVVNADHPYEFGGSYDQALQEDLVYISDVYGEATPIEKGALLAFSQLQAALHDEGMTVGIFSAYRTEEDQEWVYNYYGSLAGWTEDNPAQLPGYSEHHTGLLLNVVILYPGETNEPIWYTETAERQQNIPYFKLLHENLADFGFIDRYPAGKEDVTGVPCEPYEIRFVGSSSVAHEIMDHGLCLEEYLYGE